jgi:hypothetical protein
MLAGYILTACVVNCHSWLISWRLKGHKLSEVTTFHVYVTTWRNASEYVKFVSRHSSRTKQHTRKTLTVLNAGPAHPRQFHTTRRLYRQTFTVPHIPAWFTEYGHIYYFRTAHLLHDVLRCSSCWEETHCKSTIKPAINAQNSFGNRSGWTHAQYLFSDSSGCRKINIDTWNDNNFQLLAIHGQKTWEAQPNLKRLIVKNFWHGRTLFVSWRPT